MQASANNLHKCKHTQKDLQGKNSCGTGSAKHSPSFLPSLFLTPPCDLGKGTDAGHYQRTHCPCTPNGTDCCFTATIPCHRVRYIGTFIARGRKKGNAGKNVPYYEWRFLTAAFIPFCNSLFFKHTLKFISRKNHVTQS